MDWHRGIIVRLGAAIAAMLLPAAAWAAVPPLTVMTFNIRLPLSQDGANAWDNRRDIAVAAIAGEDPDIVATQELHKPQGDYLAAKLPGFTWFGLDRRGGHADEHMGILYRPDRFTLWHSGNFWLSSTPEVPGSISLGNLYPRMLTWGLFERKSDRRRFYLLNTHLPYRPEDQEARRAMAAMIASWTARFPPDIPVILLGDFNDVPGSPAHRLLTSSFEDAWAVASQRAGPAETFHAFGGKADRRIDWILTRGFRVAGVRTVDRHLDGRYPSDHFPVVASLVFTGPRSD